MTEAKKESLSSEELGQVSGGKKLVDEQSSIFMQDGTASRADAEASSKIAIL